ncbi:hypothetical protein BT96DRAFT_930213 [Gymnopus androsaceus JB14]|uniref:Uncharacterized protein n=1 Tax=Gymnopus androsaceus JB14 TaxID=1447944 RepID=A0A6A4GAW5_9AGAR|nr:hypothetical protein BT96DRAFT_930213 [Gymnopus androsaceus JB14]
MGHKRALSDSGTRVTGKSGSVVDDGGTPASTIAPDTKKRKLMSTTSKATEDAEALKVALAEKKKKEKALQKRNEEYEKEIRLTMESELPNGLGHMGFMRWAEMNQQLRAQKDLYVFLGVSISALNGNALVYTRKGDTATVSVGQSLDGILKLLVEGMDLDDIIQLVALKPTTRDIFNRSFVVYLNPIKIRKDVIRNGLGMLSKGLGVQLFTLDIDVLNNPRFGGWAWLEVSNLTPDDNDETVDEWFKSFNDGHGIVPVDSEDGDWRFRYNGVNTDMWVAPVILNGFDDLGRSCDEATAMDTQEGEVDLRKICEGETVSKIHQNTHLACRLVQECRICGLVTHPVGKCLTQQALHDPETPEFVWWRGIDERTAEASATGKAGKSATPKVPKDKKRKPVKPAPPTSQPKKNQAKGKGKGKAGKVAKKEGSSDEEDEEESEA